MKIKEKREVGMLIGEKRIRKIRKKDGDDEKR